MVMKYFEELEERGWKYSRPEDRNLSVHLHMPDGMPRWFPVTYWKYTKGLDTQRVIISVVNPNDPIYRLYEVTVQTVRSGPPLQEDRIEESIYGRFDSRFGSIENGESVLQKTLGCTSLEICRASRSRK